MPDCSTDPAILITIPLSHYCEKARWALDRVALPYREEPHARACGRPRQAGLRSGYSHRSVADRPPRFRFKRTAGEGND